MCGRNLISAAVLVFLLIHVLGGGEILGDQTSWQGSTGSWSTEGNWTNGLPTTQKWAIINNGGTAEIDGEDAACSSLTLGYGSSGEGCVTMASGTLQATSISVGGSATGTFSLLGGSVTGGVTVGSNPSGNGTFIMTSGEGDPPCLISGGLQVGSPPVQRFGDGYYTISSHDSKLDVEYACVVKYTTGRGRMVIKGPTTPEVNMGVLHVYGYDGNYNGTLQIGDSEDEEDGQVDAVVTLDKYYASGFAGSLVFGNGASFLVQEPGETPSTCKFILTASNGDMENSDVVVKDEYGQPVSTGLPGFLRTTLVFKGQDSEGSTKKIENAGQAVEDVGDLSEDDFNEVNYALGELVAGDPDGGDTFGPVTLELLDGCDNQDDDAPEALYVLKLTMAPGGTFKCVNSVLNKDVYFVHFPGEQGTQAPKKLHMGDANLDGKVDYADYQIWETNAYCGPGMTWQDGDFNGDRYVNFADYQILEVNFGSGGDGDGPARALPVLKDYDDDGDVDLDDLHILQEMESEEANAGTAITKELSHDGDDSNSRWLAGYVCLFGVCLGLCLCRRHHLAA